MGNAVSNVDRPFRYYSDPGVNNDPHQLDADNDGIACERDERWGTGGKGGDGSTVTPPSPPTVTPPTPPSGG